MRHMAEKDYNFQKLAKGVKVNPFDMTSKASREWFRDQAMNVKKMSVADFQKTATPFQNLENLSIKSIGKMYSFVYDPKWKETLPYYDTFPLVFPFDLKSDRMLGLNMHYLPPGARASLMNALYDTLNNSKGNSTTQLKLSYQVLMGASQFKAFKPCIKSYLFDHVRSPFMYVSPQLWDYTLMLPLARFQKKSADFVWIDSMLKVR
jgi:hypothetical protein